MTYLNFYMMIIFKHFDYYSYSSKLKLTRWSTIRKGAAFGLLAGWVYLIGYMIYSVGFGVGSIFMNKGQADPKLFHDVIVVSHSVSK